jgi:hypothetical protein
MSRNSLYAVSHSPKSPARGPSSVSAIPIWTLHSKSSSNLGKGSPAHPSPDRVYQGECVPVGIVPTLLLTPYFFEPPLMPNGLLRNAECRQESDQTTGYSADGRINSTSR